MSDPGVSELEHVPGPAGWDRILQGVSSRLEVNSGATERLQLACERYRECLDALGGSKSSALRKVAADADRSNEADPSSLRARRKWFEAAAEVVGYRMELRLSLRFVRPSPEKPGWLDVAMVNGFLGCWGHRGSLPLAITRYSTDDGITLVPGSDPSASAYTVLKTATSSPPPNLVSASDHDRNTVFIEPSWADRREPLDVSIMQLEPSAMETHHTEEPPLLVLSSLMLHPARRLVVQSLLHPDLAAVNVGRFAAYRDLVIMGQNRDWYDRLPESAKAEPIDRSRQSNEFVPFRRYDEFVAEVDAKLGWDLDGYAGHQAIVEHPIPFARYAMEYEYQAST